MSRLRMVFAVCLGLAAGAGCGGEKVPDGAKPGGLTADEMKQGSGGGSPPGGTTADQMKKGNPRR
jgi:hypothetical protein